MRSNEASSTQQVAAQPGMDREELHRRADELLHLQAKALDAAANTIIITDRNGTMLWANRAAEQNYGYSLAELVGKNPRLFQSGRHDRAFYQKLWATVLDGQVWSDTIFNLTKDGALIQEEMTITPVVDEAGEVTHFFAIKQNITERKRLEEALHLTQFAVDRISDAVFLAKPDGGLVYVNDAARALLGYTGDELLSRTMRDIDPGHDAESWPRHWEALRELGSYTAERRHRTAAGVLLPVEVSVNHLTFEGTEYYCALVRDITERKKSEDALRLMVEGTAAKTGQAFFRSCVRYLARVLGVRCALVTEAVGEDRARARPLAAWAGDGFLELGEFSVLGDPCEAIFLRGEPCTYRDNLSEHFPGHATLAPLSGRSYQGLPLFDERQAVIGHLAVLDDRPLLEDHGRESILKIFAARAGAELLRQRSEEQLREAKEKADTANEAKSQFLANMSHELRTPLNGVLGYAQILERDTELGERQLEAVQVIKSSGEHLLGLINDVLDLSKVEAAKIELEPDTFRFDVFLESIRKAFAARGAEQGIRFVTDFDDTTDTTVIADERRLRQVLFNLIGNALKFTDEGEVRFAVQRRGSYTRFEVVDTGPGIAENEIAHIFEPFHQAGNRERRTKGTGLGLTISRTLVRLMGAELEVESQLGKGSRFWFALELPATGETQLLRGPDEPQIEGYAGARRRILLVDDRPQNRQVLREMLEPLGLQISEANDGREALVVAARTKPDLVLMDLHMPDMDGLQTTRIIRRATWGRGMPVVAISGSAYDLNRQACLDAGCNDFLAKPFRARDLMAVISRLLGLEWIYLESPGSAEPSAEATIPPPEELAALMALCREGDIMAVRQRAEALREAAAGYGDFAGTLLELAAQFRIKAIRELLRQHVGKDACPTASPRGRP